MSIHGQRIPTKKKKEDLNHSQSFATDPLREKEN